MYQKPSKFRLNVQKIDKIYTFFKGVAIFAGEKPPEADLFGSHIFVTKLLRSCDEVAQDSHEVAEKFS